MWCIYIYITYWKSYTHNSYTRFQGDFNHCRYLSALTFTIPATLSISPAANPRYLLCRSDEWLEQTPAKWVKALGPVLWTLQGCRRFFFAGRFILILIHSSQKSRRVENKPSFASCATQSSTHFFSAHSAQAKEHKMSRPFTLPLFSPVSIHFPLRGIIDKDSKRGMQQGWLVYLVCLILTGPCTTGEKVCPPLDGLSSPFFFTVQHFLQFRNHSNIHWKPPFGCFQK